MQAALIKQGPLSVLINALLLQFYRSGVWDPFLKCNPQSLDHGNIAHNNGALLHMNTAFVSAKLKQQA